MSSVEGGYKPGERAPVSGIYSVSHAGHRPPHEVMVIRGDKLPACRTCKLEVTFKVERILDHLTHDMDFAGPASQPEPMRRKAA